MALYEARAAEIAEAYPEKEVTLVQSHEELVPGYSARMSRRILSILRGLKVEVSESGFLVTSICLLQCQISSADAYLYKADKATGRAPATCQRLRSTESNDCNAAKPWLCACDLKMSIVGKNTRSFVLCVDKVWFACDPNICSVFSWPPERVSVP